MARKPNYAFERNTRAKAKAAKREAKRQAKLAAKSQTTDVEMSNDDTGQATEDNQDEARNHLGSDASPESG